MTWDAKLAEWQAACEQSTTGPLKAYYDGPGLGWGVETVQHLGVASGFGCEGDARFFVLARTALPEAIARIRELTAALEQATEDLEHHVSYVPEYFRDKYEMDADVKTAREKLKP